MRKLARKSPGRGYFPRGLKKALSEKNKNPTAYKAVGLVAYGGEGGIDNKCLWALITPAGQRRQAPRPNS